MTVIHDADLADLGSMPAQISMPYTLTPGRATGIYLAELRNRRLIGSRHGADGPTLVPAQDHSGSGAPAVGFVELAARGTVEACTTTEHGTIALIRVEGADVPMVHRIVDQDLHPVQAGDAVEAVWIDSDDESALAGFRFSTVGAGSARPIDPADLAEPLEQVGYLMTLEYDHAYGPYYGTLFDGIKHGRRIRGVRCAECRRVLVPPRGRCDICFASTQEWVDVSSVGTIQACSVVHIEFIGQRLKPPYIYAEIVLDGSSTRLIHMVGGARAEADMMAVSPGDRVRAVWSDRHTGSLADIEHFELLDEEES
jgi:uncharacterized OB-fold protein